MNTRAILVLLAAGGLAAACATPPPPAALEFARQDCASAPDLSAAISLTPKSEKKAYEVSTPVGAETPCLNRAGANAPYLVYALPSDFGDKTLNVGAGLEGVRIFAPDVSILDAQGNVTRTFVRSDYLYRGLVYSVQFRPRENEKYVLVASDPSLIGQRYDSINIGTNTTSTYAAGAAISWTAGVDDNQSRAFSYEGTVRVSVYDSDTEETQ